MSIRLGWDTWSEMREFADVGKLADGKPEGWEKDGKLFLCVPTKDGVLIIVEGAVIEKAKDGTLFVVEPS